MSRGGHNDMQMSRGWHKCHKLKHKHLIHLLRSHSKGHTIFFPITFTINATGNHISRNILLKVVLEKADLYLRGCCVNVFISPYLWESLSLD